MAEKTLPGERERGSGTIAHKQGYAKIVFQPLNARTDCGLGYMQPVGCFKKAAIGNHP